MKNLDFYDIEINYKRAKIKYKKLAFLKSEKPHKLKEIDEKFRNVKNLFKTLKKSSGQFYGDFLIGFKIALEDLHRNLDHEIQN